MTPQRTALKSPGLPGIPLAQLCALLLIPTALLVITGFQQGWPDGWDAWLSGHITMAWQGEGRLLKDAGLTAVIAAMGWLYWRHSQCWLNQPDRPVSLRRILMSILPGLLLLTLVVPFHSSDLYGYINRGVQQAVFHVNPYLVTVGQMSGWQDNPLFHEHWVFNPSPYGFVFTRLADGIARLSPDHFTGIFLSFKLLNVLVFLLTLHAVWRLTTILKPAHNHPRLAAALTGFSPVLWLHLIGNGHNDLLMTLLLLWSLLALFSRQKTWLCLPLLLLSVLIKYASLLALPFILIRLIRLRAWRALLTGSLIAIMFFIAFAAGYWPQAGEHWPLAQMGGNASMSQHSLHSALSRAVYYFGLMFGQDWLAAARGFFKALLWGLFAAFYGWQLVRFWRHSRQTQSAEALVQTIALVLLAMVAFASSKFHGWYTGMFLPLTFCLPVTSRLFRFAYAFSLVQLLAFTPLENLHVLNALLFLGLPLWFSLRPAGRAQPHQA
ncbi:MAG: hypothetical protein AB7P76_05485 [Candidatus Melainabacteria bacterium]